MLLLYLESYLLYRKLKIIILIFCFILRCSNISLLIPVKGIVQDLHVDNFLGTLGLFHI